MSEVARERRPPYVAVIGDGALQGPDAHRLLEWAGEIGLSWREPQRRWSPVVWVA